MEKIGKILLITGIILVIIGIIFIAFKKIPFIPGKLPGDIVIEKGNFKFYFPIVTSIIVSIIISVVIYIISRFMK